MRSRSPSPVRTSLSKRRRALAKHLPAALTGDSHAVHQARVASRRLRETLPIVGADLDGAKAAKGAKKVRRRMRRLTRALGPVRELEVALGMIAPPPEPDPTTRGRAHVAAMLRRDLEKARERMTGDLGGEKVVEWLGHMEAIEDALEPGDGEVVSRAKAAAPAEASRTPTRTRARRAARPEKWRAELADRLDTRAANLKKALDEAGVLFVSERLHQVRIALKRLRYAMELAGELRVTSTAAAVRDLKSVQDVLGSLHDHDVLMEYTASAGDQPGLARPTRASLIALHGSLDSVRHQLHAQYLAARPTLERLYLRSLDVAVRARAGR